MIPHRLGLLEGEISALFVVVPQARTSWMLVERVASYLILCFPRTLFLQQDEENRKLGI